MSADLTRPRRALIAAVALFIAAFAFRAQVADALVIRGDDLFYRNDMPGARSKYLRAIAIDPNLSTAVDRFAFTSMLERTPRSLDAAVDVASAYLKSNPPSAAILGDRGLCFLIERRYERAYADFSAAAMVARDPRYYVFAGSAAERIGLHERAERLWRAALSIDPSFRPALIALREQTR